ncbi:hypothetical protein O6H91_03G040300 [Diphasiastrum complanatum]|uniref:Uncharacterized protein n=1 Tax=Diphasiastrum complanatum TaxID=34168 RepID=A0ACC2E5I9_DIPCM|nr:hypothetical protein O6H91_03G040300 [Diphasiastrum complanatum]
MAGQVQQSSSVAPQHHHHHGGGGPHHHPGSAGTGDAVMARWLQSAGLQHLAAPLAAAALDHRLLPSLLMQDYARYGVQSLEDKQKLFRLIKTISSGADTLPDASSAALYSRSGNHSGIDSILSHEFGGDFGAGILDLHAIDDTELLSGASISEPFESSPSFIPVIERGFEIESETVGTTNKQLGRQKVLVEEAMRSLSREKDSSKESGLARIKVVVRKRPVNKKELARKEDDIVTIDEGASSLTVHEPKLKVDLTAYVEKHEFTFDAVLDHHVTNDEVYRVTVEPIVPTIFNRTKATCFAYGQTGSGKTYTMQPLPLRASKDILNIIQQPANRNQGFQLWLSFFEIYGGKLYDLLNDRRKLCMREDGRQQVCIVGLQEFQVSDVQLVNEYIEKGNSARSTGSTGANEESSRSHAILQLVVKKCPDGNEAKGGRLVGKFSFIDLAGSERGADTTDNDRQTRIEGAEINKSLLALKECIRALDNDQGHIPFRGSKLTEVLRDSFVGDSRTVMISCISPNTGSCEHTLNTLRYADRVKGLSKNSNSKKDFTATALPQKEAAASPPTPSPPNFQAFEQFQDTMSVESGRQSFEQYGYSNHNEFEGSSVSFATLSSIMKEENKPVLARTEKPTFRENSLNGMAYQHEFASGRGSFPDSLEQEKVQNVLPYRRNKPREEKSESQMNLGSRNDVTKLEGMYSNPKYQYQKEEFALSGLSRAKDASSIEATQNGYDGQINAILEEEEEVISIHRKEVEDTMEIVREQEMKLLTEVDQPGSRIDRYVTQLNFLLSRKAAGIVNLQSRLARFQRHLKEQEILSRTGVPR